MAMCKQILPKLDRKRTTVSLFAGAIVALAGLFGVILLPNQRAAADNHRYVTVHYDGASQTLATDAKTVGEVLDRAHIPVGERDAIEPAASTELVANDYNVNVYRARPVTVVDNGQRYAVTTAAQSPRKMAESAGLTIYDEDRLDVNRIDDFISEGSYGLKVTVQRSVPVTLNMYGTPTAIRTQATTVGQLLKEKKISLKEGDTVSPSIDTPITPAMGITLVRNGTQTVTLEEEVAFTTKTIQDADQPVGYKKVTEEGQKGVRVVTYEVKVENGQEVARKEINSVTKTEPKQQVETVGVKPNFSGDISAALAKLRACESGGNYANKKNPSYRGAYQFGYSTWGNFGGYYDPADAPPAVQDEAAYNLYKRRGWQPWPVCGAGLPDTYR